MLPILHLNGYKIAGPTVLARFRRILTNSKRCSTVMVTSRISSKETTQGDASTSGIDLGSGLCEDSPHQAGRAPPNGLKAAAALADDRVPHPERMDGAEGDRWTASIEGYFRAHQVPMGDMHENPAHIRILERWMKSYLPDDLFDHAGSCALSWPNLRPEAIAA